MLGNSFFSGKIRYIIQLDFIKLRTIVYRAFFGLNQLPFKISPDLTFFYKQATRSDIVDALIYSIERGDGIVKVVGEVGVGKTTLLRELLESLPENFQRIFVNSPNLKPIDFLRFICRELGVEDKEQDTKLDLLKKLNITLLEAYDNNKRVVMLIDEAQAMTLDTLEEIRLLGNLESGNDKLLQIVMFGQPELDVTLNDLRVRPLKDRIACHISVPPFSVEEVFQYLNYRIRVAGHLDGDLFSRQVAKKVHKLSNGLPRKVNLIADKLLMAAFSQEDEVVKAKHFAIAGLKQTREFTQYQPYFLAILTLFVVGVVAYIWLEKPAAPPLVSAVVKTPVHVALTEQQLKPLLKENLRGRIELKSLSKESEIVVAVFQDYARYQSYLNRLLAETEIQPEQVYTVVRLHQDIQQSQFIIWLDKHTVAEKYVLNNKKRFQPFKVIKVVDFADIML